MYYEYRCCECGKESSDQFESETEAEQDVLEHLAWDHGYEITAYYSNGDYAYQQIT